MKRFLFLITLFTSCSCYSQSLNDAELNNQYWTYKDRFLKQFTYVGKKNGESSVVNKYTNQIQKVIDKNTGNDIEYTGKLEFGDALVDQGLYLCVLATEYKLLKDAGKDLTQIRNELYYTIEAVNRLDENAEWFYDPTLKIKNGFCIRTDAPDGFYERFEEMGDEAHFQHSDASNGRKPVVKQTYNGVEYWTDKDGNYIKEDWYNAVITDKNGFNSYDGTGHGYGCRVNEMSQDQIFGVMLGLGFVVKYVNNDFVKPQTILTSTDPDRGFNLVDEAKIIVERLIDNLSARKTVDAQSEGLEGFTPNGDNVEQVAADWMAVNPVKNKCVARGPLATQLGYTYPAIKAAGKILGSEKSGWNPDDYIDIWYNGPVITLIPYPTLPPPIPFPCPDLTPACPPYTFLGNVKYQFPIKPQETTFWALFGNSSTLPFYNRNHLWKLGCLSGLVDQDDFHDFCTSDDNTKFDKTYIEIINAAYNDLNPKKDQSYYRTVLSSSYCDGSRQHNFGGNTRLSYGCVEDMWSMNQYFEDNGVTPREGEFNGLDWMLLYNLYRLKFSANISSNYTNLGCPCQSSKQFYTNNNPTNTHLSTLSSVKNDIPFRFPGYKDYAILIPEWLTQNYTINSNGELRPKGDLTICNSRTTINAGGKLSTETNGNSNWKRIITVGSNAILELKANGTINVENNTKVVVDLSATLIFHPGAHIILNGPNAVLEIKGKLELKDNAVFKIEGGTAGIGYVQFENHWDAIAQKGTQEIVTGNNTRMEFIGLNNNTRTQKLLEIRGEEGLWLNTNLKKCSIKNGFVDMRKDSRIVSHCENFEMNEVSVFCSDHDVEAALHRGIHVLGTKNLFVNCDIKHGNPGLRIFAIEGNNPLMLQHVEISECSEGIRSESGNVWASNVSSVQNCWASGISLTGVAGYSKLLDSKVKFSTNGGLDYHGSGKFYINNSLFTDNGYAASVTEGRLEPRCSRFSSNYQRGIHLNKGTLIGSQGFNVFDHTGDAPNAYGISKLFSGNKAIWYLENGKSYIDLINYSGTVPANQISSSLSNIQPIVPYSSPTTTGFAVNGNVNCWVQTGSNLTTNMYSLTQNSMNLFLQNGAIPSVAAGTFDAYQTQNCSVLPIKKPMDYLMDFINPFNSGTTFTRRNRTGSGTTSETFTNGLNSARTLADQLSPDYEGSIMLLHDMMGINFPSANRHVWFELYNASQHVYFTALSDSAWQDSASFPLRQNLYTIMNQKQDALLSLSSVDSIGGYWQPMHFDFVRDKSLLYRSIGQRNTAIGYINTKLNDFADTIDRNGLVVWQCIYKQEQDYLDSLIPLDSVNLHFNCIGPWLDSSSGDTLPPENMMMNNNNYQNYGDRVFKNKPKKIVDKQGKEDRNTETALKPVVKSKPQILFKIYPNPTDNSATVLAYNSPTETKFSLELRNNIGNLISQTQFNGTTTLNTANLSEGVYTVSCIGANGFNFHTKLVVIHKI